MTSFDRQTPIEILSGPVQFIYRFLNLFFHFFHVCVIVFTLFGWIFKETRLANLILILLTMGSWYVLGKWLGKDGYCPVTDWHWKIKEKMGNTSHPDSYIKLWLDRLSRQDLNSDKVNLLTLIATIASGTISLILNVLDWF